MEDPIRDFLDPAIKGTTGILSSVHAHAPTVKRVVLTSSSAAMLNPLQHAKCYDESFWNPFTFEDVTTPGHELGQYAYPASKKLAEQAAWSFMSTAQPRFTLTVCNPTYTFGPIAPPFPALSSLDNLNTSSHLVRDLVLGRYRDATVLPPTNPVFTFVDVRDIAMAHVRAMTTPAAGGLRFYIVGGHWSVRRIRDILWEEFPDLRERLPPPGRGDDDDLDEGTVYRFDNTRSRNVLGMTYHGLRESIVDAARSVLEFVEKESTACAVLNGTAA